MRHQKIPLIFLSKKHTFFWELDTNSNHNVENCRNLGRKQIFLAMTKRKREIGDDEEIIIVDSKQHADLTVEQKWAIVAFCMEDYDTKTRKLGYDEGP